MARRLTASALFYAIVVTLLVGSVVGGMIMLVHHRALRTERWLAREHASSNARSAAFLALHRSIAYGEEDAWDLFGEGADSAWVKVEPWGALDRVLTRARRGDQEVTISALAGHGFDDRFVLQLASVGGPLHVCGDARIHGDVRVAQGDVRRGHIEGRAFTGNELVDGHVQRSSGERPRLREELERRLPTLCAGLPLGDEVVLDLIGLERSVQQGDGDQGIRTVLLHGPAQLADLSVRGPVIFRCDDSLFVAASVHFDRVILQAPYVQIADGAELNVQCFASEGIEVGVGVRLLFPSMLAVWRDTHRAEGAHITLGEQTLLQGAAIAVDRSVRGRDKSSITVGPGAQVMGEIFSEGDVQHQGDICGTLVANGMVLRTPASVYRGHLLDGVLRRYDQGVRIGFGCMDGVDERGILQWGELQHTKG